MAEQISVNQQPSRSILGALLHDGLCRFRVWAPDASEVFVQLEGDARRTRLECDHGYHAGAVGRIRAGQRYWYEIDGMRMPDPCSRFQPEGPHGPSEIVDTTTYQWRDDCWTGIAMEGLVLYELHIGSFTTEGTFEAATSRLGHLKRLGVGAIEIMPIAECPGEFNWGYDGVAWFAPSQA
jgi:maltooligosyltrehalose trehalohydrolase